MAKFNPELIDRLKELKEKKHIKSVNGLIEKVTLKEVNRLENLLQVIPVEERLAEQSKNHNSKD